MAKFQRTDISVDGDEFAPGSLTVEADGLLSWHGTVSGQRMPGPTVRMIAISGGHVYAGMALITKVTLPSPDGDEQPVNEFHGNGPLGRHTLTEVAEWLMRTDEDER